LYIHTDVASQAQTPQQRKANQKFAKAEEEKRGKPQANLKKKVAEKSPISVTWLSMFPCPSLSQECVARASGLTGVLGLLAFVIIGGIFFELVRIFW
jgi:hypothetical protein